MGLSGEAELGSGSGEWASGDGSGTGYVEVEDAYEETSGDAITSEEVASGGQDGGSGSGSGYEYLPLPLPSPAESPSPVPMDIEEPLPSPDPDGPRPVASPEAPAAKTTTIEMSFRADGFSPAMFDDVARLQLMATFATELDYKPWPEDSLDLIAELNKYYGLAVVALGRRRQLDVLDEASADGVEVTLMIKELNEEEGARVYAHIQEHLACVDCIEYLTLLVQSTGGAWSNVEPYGVALSCDDGEVCLAILEAALSGDCAGYECDAAYIIVPAIVLGVALCVLAITVVAMLRRRKRAAAKVAVDWSRTRTDAETHQGY